MKNEVEGMQTQNTTEAVNNNVKNETKSKTKFNYWKIATISISILLIIIVAIIVIINLKLPIFSQQIKFTNEDLTELLKRDKLGIYLQDDSVKLGYITDISYQNYDKLISYSAFYINNEVTLNAGGILLYNSSTNENETITLYSDLMSVLYYIITNDMDTEVKETTEVFAKYIEKNGINVVNISEEDKENNELFFELGSEIGQIVGVNLCRNIGRKELKDLFSEVDTKYLYKENEISARYYGCNTTDKKYVWDTKFGIDEQTMKALYAYNRTSYNQMVIMYGNPYENVTKFSVFDATSGKLVGSYNSFEEAEKKLLKNNNTSNDNNQSTETNINNVNNSEKVSESNNEKTTENNKQDTDNSKNTNTESNKQNANNNQNTNNEDNKQNIISPDNTYETIKTYYDNFQPDVKSIDQVKKEISEIHATITEENVEYTFDKNLNNKVNQLRLSNSDKFSIYYWKYLDSAKVTVSRSFDTLIPSDIQANAAVDEDKVFDVHFVVKFNNEVLTDKIIKYNYKNRNSAELQKNIVENKTVKSNKGNLVITINGEEIYNKYKELKPTTELQYLYLVG